MHTPHFKPNQTKPKSKCTAQRNPQHWHERNVYTVQSVYRYKYELNERRKTDKIIEFEFTKRTLRYWKCFRSNSHIHTNTATSQKVMLMMIMIIIIMLIIEMGDDAPLAGGVTTFSTIKRSLQSYDRSLLEIISIAICMPAAYIIKAMCESAFLECLVWLYDNSNPCPASNAIFFLSTTNRNHKTNRALKKTAFQSSFFNENIELYWLIWAQWNRREFKNFMRILLRMLGNFLILFDTMENNEHKTEICTNLILLMFIGVQYIRWTQKHTHNQMENNIVWLLSVQHHFHMWCACAFCRCHCHCYCHHRYDDDFMLGTR